MSLLLTRQRQFAIKVEGTEGTAETLAASDVDFEVEELSSSYTNEMNERNPLRQSLSGVPTLPGIGVGEITGKVELVGGGAAGTTPPTDLLWKACGYTQRVTSQVDLTGAPTGTFLPGETVTDGGTKIVRFVTLLPGDVFVFATISGADLDDGDGLTGSLSGATATVATPDGLTALNYAYTPDSDAPDSVTAADYFDGMRRIVFGARGTGQVTIEGAGKIPYLNFTLSGAATKPIDAALLSGVVLPTVTPEAFLSAGVTVHGDLVCIDAFTADMANTVARRPCANAASGIISYRITERSPVVTIDPEAQLEADVDFWTKYDAGTAFGFFAQCGATASKRLAVCAPNAQYGGLTDSDREGVATYDAPLRCNGAQVAGDDEIMFAFY